MKKSGLIFAFLIAILMNALNAQNAKKLRLIDEIKVDKVDEIIPVLLKYMNLSKGNTFVDNGVCRGDSLIAKTSAYIDALGYTHIKYRQYFDGVPVEGTNLRVHLKDNKIIYVNGEYYPLNKIDVHPDITVDNAIDATRRYIVAMLKELDEEFITIAEPELLICRDKADIEDTSMLLCYRLKVLPLNYCVYVNAHNGVPVGYVSTATFHNGTADTRYSGTQSIKTVKGYDFLFFGSEYYLYDENLRIHTKDLRGKSSIFGGNAREFVDENDNIWTSLEFHNNEKDDGALDAHWGLEQSYEYFLQNHGWKSLDNHGCDIEALVHAKIAIGLDESGSLLYTTNSAAFFPQTNRFEFGDGEGNRDIHTSLDIVAHEFAHGIFHHLVNSYDIDAAEANETNAINEGLSDIWGACVENWATEGKQTWLIGEDICYDNDAIRNMSNPKSKGHPDTYRGTYWDTPCIERHKNAGVLTYWFYLLVNGGTGVNDNGFQYNVHGIGIEKAAKIVFRAETTYMDSQTDYSDICEYTIRAAYELYSGHELASTVEAWRAVGLMPDYYTKDNVCDIGGEPLQNISNGCQNSPDIWLRRMDDSGLVHQKAKHNSVNYVYVNVHNRGVQSISESDSIELYVKKASLCVDVWPQGWVKIGSASLPPLAANESQIVKIDAQFPAVNNNFPFATSESNVDYAMLTRIVSDVDVMSYIETGNTLMNVMNNNNISYKNVVASSAMYFNDITEQVAVLDIDNEGGLDLMTNIHFVAPNNVNGAQLTKEAEVRLIFESGLLELWKAKGVEFDGLKLIDDTTFIVTSSKAFINGAIIPKEYCGYMRMQINFLTRKYSDKFAYEYHVSEYDIDDSVLLGCASIVVYKNPRDVLFEAKAKKNMMAKKNTSALLVAESISEDAVYKWYDADGDLIGTGDTLTVDILSTTKYTLEVIAKSDGYKDYDSVNVIVLYGSIEGFSPNPANTHVAVTYDLAEDITNALIIVTGNMGQVVYSAPIDVMQTTHVVNLQGIPAGLYMVCIMSRGTVLDNKTLIVY